LSYLPADAERRPLRRPITRTEFALLVALMTINGAFAVLLHNGTPLAHDYVVFLKAAAGGIGGFYYLPLILPVFTVLLSLPFALGFFLWNTINIGGLWLGGRVFGGKLAPAFLSYQAVYCLFYGQIVGWVAGSLALMDRALAYKRWLYAGGLWALACIKIQLGFPVGLAMLLVADIPHIARLRVILGAGLAFMVGFALYPNWLNDIYYASQTVGVNTFGSISLWRYIGAWSLLVWLLIGRVPRERRVAFVLTATALSLVYFQQTDLLLLYLFPVGYWALLGNLGYLMIFYGWQALPLMALTAAGIYGMLVWRGVRFGRGVTQKQSISP